MNLRSLLRLAFVATTLAFVSSALAGPERWAANIDKFTHADATNPPPRNGIVFIGSSSIVGWKSLAKDFPGLPTINRGFGGSQLEDSVFYADRIVIPYAPRTVVLYAGDNDIAAGKTPETVLADFRAFREKIHAALPDTRVLYLSIKLSPSRAKFKEAAVRTNELIAADCAAAKNCTFVDVNAPLLDHEGNPRPIFFRKDMLHLLPWSYDLWTEVLAPHLVDKAKS
jgi:hypothetical protein